MPAVPRTYADVQGFITMLIVACEDATINSTLQQLLSQPDHLRHAALQKLVAHLRASAAPTELIDAIICLLDDRRVSS